MSKSASFSFCISVPKEQASDDLTVFPITHNCGSITHKFQFLRTDERFLRHVDAYIFSAIETIDSESENNANSESETTLACIPICRFHSDADWLNIHFFSPLSLQFCYHY